MAIKDWWVIGKAAPPTGTPIAVKDHNGLIQHVTLDAAGNIPVSVSGAGSGGTSSTFGSTFPVAGTAAGFIDNSGNMAGATLDASGYLKVNVSAGAAGGGAATIADGADVTEGAIANTAVTGDNTGTISAKLRGFNKVLADVWDSVNHVLKISAASLPLPSGAATSAKQPALGTAGTASTDVLSIQGIASMTKLLVTPDSVALPANQSINVSQLAGTTTDTNSGSKSAGTLRVVLATDQPALTNKLLVTPDLPSGASTAAKQPALGTAGTASTDVISIQGIASMTKLLVTPDSVALPANQSVNIAQMNGVTTTMGNGASGTGVQRVTLANDSTGIVALTAGSASIGKISDITTSVVPGTGATHLGKAEDGAHTSGDTGVLALAVRNDSSAAFSGTDLDYTPIATDAAGRVNVLQKASTATLSNVASSASSVTLLSANTARIGAQFYNDSTQICFLKLGTTASSTSFTVALASAVYYELPCGYTGRIDGIWVSANGNMRVTEVT